MPASTAPFSPYARRQPLYDQLVKVFAKSKISIANLPILNAIKERATASGNMTWHNGEDTEEFSSLVVGEVCAFADGTKTGARGNKAADHVVRVPSKFSPILFILLLTHVPQIREGGTQSSSPSSSVPLGGDHAGMEDIFSDTIIGLIELVLRSNGGKAAMDKFTQAGVSTVPIYALTRAYFILSKGIIREFHKLLQNRSFGIPVISPKVYKVYTLLFDVAFIYSLGFL